MIPPLHILLFGSLGCSSLSRGGLAIPLSLLRGLAREGYQREPYGGYTESEVVYT